MEVLDKKDVQVVLGRNGLLADNSTLAGKLVYKDGIIGFDKLLNGKSEMDLKARIHITKFPRGINIKLILKNKRYPVGILFKDIQNINIDRNILAIKLKSGRKINFSFKESHAYGIREFFNTYIIKHLSNPSKISSESIAEKIVDSEVNQDQNVRYDLLPSQENQITTSRKLRAIIVNKVPKIYQDKGLTVPHKVALALESEFDVLAVKGGNVVQIILPDSTVGFIHGDEELHFVQPSWTLFETKVYSSPDESNSQHETLKKGEEFELLNTLERTNDSWGRVRLNGGQVSYMRGNVKVITQESLLQSIAELIGQRKSEEKIVKKYSDQGIPELKIRTLYNEVVELGKQYRSSPEGRKELATKAQRQVLYGFLWAVGGGIATGVSYNSAGMGDSYFVFYGAIVWGVIDIVRGIAGSIKFSS
jgi:hypothetical protein